MRSGIYLGITVVLVVLLPGCGRKGPLMLPPTQAQAPLPQAIQIQAPGRQATEPQQPGTPSLPQGKQP